MKTVAQHLVEWMKSLDVEIIFGIPGVHTIELYRALTGSGIRHVTARHEAGAGFMADGYARVSGRFGVALVITGPGVTNILTPMAQARADSVPMLVISGVNARPTLGRGLGYLHELPDQLALTSSLGPAFHLDTPEALPGILSRVDAALSTGRGGPVHLQVPLDLMAAPSPAATRSERHTNNETKHVETAIEILSMAKAPVILAGGGCRRSEGALRACAETFGAPVIQTTNARGLMHGHPLTVPASPSLEPVRDLLRQADAVLVAGSELGPTDIDMYGRGGWPELARMARIDICPAQLARHAAAVVVQGDVRDVLPRIVRRSAPAPDGPARAAATRAAARAALSEAMRDDIRMLEALRAARPGAIVVGDSTHAVYAGNLFYDHDRPGGWFNAATGYGALGYATGAAVGAALAAPGVPVLCLIGDGGLMFAPGEVMTAVEEGLDISYVVLNNRGFGEIAEAMRAAGAEPFGCKPEPPDLKSFSKACRLHFRRCTKLDVGAELATMHGPAMIEVTLPPVK